jgi:hypothetical protein
MTTFDEFVADLAEEARAEGPDAVAELDAFGLRFSLARQLAASGARRASPSGSSPSAPRSIGPRSAGSSAAKRTSRRRRWAP